MRLLGIDYGEKNVGIALSDDKGMMAFPKAVLPNDNFLMTEVKNLIAGHGVGAVVIGESKDYKMKDNRIMAKARAFADELARDTGIAVAYEPELLSSHQAAHFQGKTAMIDASAASIILQSYIDRAKNTENTNDR
ncbi:MAG: RuvX/YqgF family protein [Candidatus Paceibacterota bacterium]|jgi:putative Holliday junction resolvase